MRRFLSGMVLALLLLASPARAGDHDDARRAVLAGEILPLTTILDRVNADYPGELIEAELERKHGRMVYEIKQMTRDGKLMKLYYDARDGSRISAKEKP
ncbi:hypothetical protein A6A04_00640 [Paramagnetospirillum marisnigri]|uniref:PepSY domain-containing protein n=1 Tax=Paramagnetospirillum marisnigri TaxID=1285242 RepID=A0A178MTU1_9PROT|nr:PepSY domain-containing protein [Paramagnetospirillum marisnigri]OAN52237.1 hypothetical protein A6A04_00640 [Paramagnetospirillum marisnigri]